MPLFLFLRHKRKHNLIQSHLHSALLSPAHPHAFAHRVLAKDGKTRLMTLMSHKSPAVAKAALLAVQKTMVNKWDQMLSSANSTSATAAV